MALVLVRKGGVGAPAPAPFDPTTIAGLQFWMDADDASVFTFGTGTAVAQWDDKSGNGRDFVQATAANQPTRNGSQNSRTTVVFDGANDSVTSSATFALAQPMTIFNVLKNTDATVGNDRRSFLSGNPAPITGWMKSSVWTAYAGTELNSSAAVDTAWHQLSHIINGATSVIYVDAVSSASGTVGGNNGSGTWNIGHGGPESWLGEIAEILVYDSVLSAGDRVAVQAYLKTKWATP